MSTQPTAGEMLVGAYLKKVDKCELVAYRQHSPEQGHQMEVDVIGIRPGGVKEIIACEVTTHLGGLQYGNYQVSRKRIARKFRDAKGHVTKIFDHGNSFKFQLWSPVVKPGLVELLEEMADEFEQSSGFELELVINERYAEKIELLRGVAAATEAQDNELGFRFLQILEHLPTV